MTRLVYGIDFGTSNSAIVVRRPDGTEVRVTDPAAVRGGWSFPTSVALGRDGSLLVGWAAERAKLARPESYRSEFKREFGDPTPTRVGDRDLAPHDLAAEVLRFLREQARAQVPGDPEHVVIAVPASWEQGNRDLMISAATAAGFAPETITLIDEPIAAAHAAAGGTGTMLVYDLGGGTFDCAVARESGGVLEVLGSPGGLPDVGGGAFDRAVLAEVRRRFPDECAALFAADVSDPSVLRRRLQLRGSCEDAKVALSVAGSTEAFLTELVPPVELVLTRDELASLIERMLRATLAECDRMLDTLGMAWSEIDRIVPVGGSTRLPVVQELLARHSGRPVLRLDDPELAIADGGALVASADVRRSPSPDPGIGLLEHDGPVLNVAFGPNSRQLATSTATGVTRLWDSYDLVEIRQMKDPDPPGDHRALNGLSFCPQGRTIATGRTDGTVALYRPDNGDHLGGGRHNDTVARVRHSPDGRYIVSASFTGKARLWVAATGREVVDLRHERGMVVDAVFSPDMAHAATAGTDGLVLVWNVASGECLQRWQQSAGASRVTFSPDGNYLLIGVSDGSVSVCDLHEPEQGSNRIHDDEVLAVAWHPEFESTFVTAGADHMAIVTSKLLGDFRIFHRSPVQDALFTPDGQYVVTGCQDGTVSVWYPYGREPRLMYEHKSPGPAYRIAISPDGRRIACGSANSVSILDLIELGVSLPPS